MSVIRDQDVVSTSRHERVTAGASHHNVSWNMRTITRLFCHTIAFWVGLAAMPTHVAACASIAADARGFWFAAQVRAAAHDTFKAADAAREDFALPKALTLLQAAEALFRATVEMSGDDNDRLALASTLASEGAILVFDGDRACGRALFKAALSIAQHATVAHDLPKARFVIASTQIQMAGEAVLSGRIGMAVEYLRVGSPTLEALAASDAQAARVLTTELAVAAYLARRDERYDDAIDDYLKSLAELRKRVAASPSSFNRIELAAQQAQLAVTQAHAGNRAAARASMTDAEAVVRGIYEKDSTPAIALQLAYVLLNKASLEKLVGNSEAVFRTTDEIRALLRAAGNSRSKFRLVLLANVELHEGYFEQGRHDWPAALSAYAQGALVAQILFDGDREPSNREELARMLLGALTAKVNLKHGGEAAEDLRQLEQLIDVSSVEDPTGNLRSILAAAYNDFGVSRAMVKDWQGALTFARRSLALSQQDAAGHRDRLRYVMNALGWIGDANVALGDNTGARVAYEEFLALANQATGPADSAFVKKMRGGIEARLARMRGK